MSAREVPSTMSTLSTMIRVTWRRLFRGRAVWVCLGIALLPAFLAAVVPHTRGTLELITIAEFLVMTVLPPVFVASSIGEEIEERTTTYLWSRPIARWTMIVGKLVALAPIASILIAVGWYLAAQTNTGSPPSTDSLIAFTAGGLAISVMSAGLGTLVPKQGMALAIIYLVIIDSAIGAIPASLQSISITHQVVLLSGLDEHVPKLQPAITMAVIAAVWLAIGLLRLRRREA